MSVGFTTDKSTFDSAAGTLSQQIAKWTEAALRFKLQLDGMSEADLEALGYTASDVALLKSGVGDMAQLANVYLGQAEQTPAYDFRTFMGRFGGFSLT